VKLPTGRFEIAECVIRTVLDDEFDAGRELLADVETARPGNCARFSKRFRPT
jgi:hypothetical protein